VVDPDARFRQSMGDLIEAAGLRPLLAPSAEEARKGLMESPRAVFVDDALPNGGGVAFCRSVRLSERTWDLPLIICATRDEKSLIRDCLVAGADDFLFKPLQRSEAAAKLQNLASSNPQVSQHKPILGKKVLIATRHPYYRENVSRMIKASGCEVEVAIDPELVTKAWQSRSSPDAAILDLDLIGPKGAEELQKMEGSARFPTGLVVMASSATVKHKGARWGPNGAKLWSLLTPYDADEERDEILRRVSRTLLVGASKVNQRRNARAPFEGVVRFHWEDEGDWTNGIGFDLSESGIFVRTIAPLKPARRLVEVSFRMEGTGNMTLKASVVWAHVVGPRHIATVPFGMGLTFEGVSPTDAEAIRRYVNRKLTTP
jgi:DNA-binding response OmpR family regulator